jgi:hypothetical protein
MRDKYIIQPKGGQANDGVMTRSTKDGETNFRNMKNWKHRRFNSPGVSATRLLMVASLLATEGGRRPIPVFGALRVRGVIGAMRNTALMFLAPRPVVVRALFPRWSLVMIRVSAARNTATLLLKPAPSRNLQPPLANIEKNKPYQNSFFLHL